MNKARLKSIHDAIAVARSAAVMLESARDEEQEAFDNLPEGLQQAEKGEQMEANVNTLDEAISAINDAADELDTLS